MTDEETTCNESKDSEGNLAAKEGGKAEPFAEKDLQGMLVRPLMMIDLVLAERLRLFETVKQGLLPMRLSLLFLLISLVFAIPYGCLSPAADAMDVSTLFCGSVLVCYPSLHVFSRYLGFEFGALQNLLLALAVSATAAVVSLGFAPIIWFIDYTAGQGEEVLKINTIISDILLSVCFLLGVVQMIRSFLWTRLGDWRAHFHQGFMLCWLALLTFISCRMASFLELF